MTYTVYHLLGHIHAECNTTDEVLKEVLTLIPIGKVKQRKLLANLGRVATGGWADAEHDGASVLIKRTK